eukprot:XP_003731652.2 PREDICTED: mucin-5B [Strongylocentrotus purpuratus]
MTVDTEEFSNETADASTCDVSTGLSCANRPGTPLCADYKVRYFCCSRRYTVTCSTPQPPETTTVVQTTTPQSTTEECHIEEICEWTEWCDDEEGGGKVTPFDVGEFEIKEDCKENFEICEAPKDIECEMTANPHLSAAILSQDVTCDVDYGLVCLHSDTQPICLDYRIRFLCCRNETVGPNCPTTEPPTTPPATVIDTSPPHTSKPTTAPTTGKKSLQTYIELVLKQFFPLILHLLT